MTAIPVISAIQETNQTTTSLTFVDANCTSAPLLNGRNYLVIYRGQVRNTNNAGTTRADLEARFGTTRIGFASSQEAFANTDAVSGTQLAGCCVVTGNGTDTLNMRHLTSSGAVASTSTALEFTAIDLTDLTENADWWRYESANSDAALATPAAAAGFVNIGTGLTFQAPSTGNYIVIASVEANPTADDEVGVRLQMDGVTLRNGMLHARDADPGFPNPVQNIRIVDQVALTAGNTYTFHVQGAGNGGNVAYRRVRIFVLRAARFTDVQVMRHTTGLTVTGTASGTLASSLTIPNPAPEGYGYLLIGDCCQQLTFFGNMHILLDGATAVPTAGSNVAVDTTGITTGGDIPVVALHRYLSGVVASRTASIRADKLGGAGDNRYGSNRGNTGNVDTVLIAIRMDVPSPADAMPPASPAGPGGGDGAWQPIAQAGGFDGVWQPIGWGA